MRREQKSGKVPIVLRLNFGLDNVMKLLFVQTSDVVLSVSKFAFPMPSCRVNDGWLVRMHFHTHSHACG